MDKIDEVQNNFKKICDQADAGLAYFGVRVVTRIQCIRCGALFKEDELDQLDKHLDMCKIMNKMEAPNDYRSFNV